jgi:hypothetical protein
MRLGRGPRHRHPPQSRPQQRDARPRTSAACGAGAGCRCRGNLRAHREAHIYHARRRGQVARRARARSHPPIQSSRLPWVAMTRLPHPPHPAQPVRSTTHTYSAQPADVSARTMPATLAAKRSCFFASSQDDPATAAVVSKLSAMSYNPPRSQLSTRAHVRGRARSQAHTHTRSHPHPHPHPPTHTHTHHLGAQHLAGGEHGRPQLREQRSIVHAACAAARARAIALARASTRARKHTQKLLRIAVERQRWEPASEALEGRRTAQSAPRAPPAPLPLTPTYIAGGHQSRCPRHRRHRRRREQLNHPGRRVLLRAHGRPGGERGRGRVPKHTRHVLHAHYVTRARRLPQTHKSARANAHDLPPHTQARARARAHTHTATHHQRRRAGAEHVAGSRGRKCVRHPAARRRRRAAARPPRVCAPKARRVPLHAPAGAGPRLR